MAKGHSLPCIYRDFPRRSSKTQLFTMFGPVFTQTAGLDSPMPRCALPGTYSDWASHLIFPSRLSQESVSLTKNTWSRPCLSWRTSKQACRTRTVCLIFIPFRDSSHISWRFSPILFFFWSRFLMLSLLVQSYFIKWFSFYFPNWISQWCTADISLFSQNYSPVFNSNLFSRTLPE